jgi:hypothetical protein
MKSCKAKESTASCNNLRILIAFIMLRVSAGLPKSRQAIRYKSKFCMRYTLPGFNILALKSHLVKDHKIQGGSNMTGTICV